MKSALLVIDFQNGLVGSDPRPGDAATVTANINGLLARARQCEQPIVLVQHVDSDLVPGSWAWGLFSELELEPQDYRINKHTPDSFLDTGLQAILDRHAIKHLVVCGYATEFCVDTTVRRAAAMGYEVTVAADAHTTHDKGHASAALIREHHNVTLSCLDSFGPRIKAEASDAIVSATEPSEGVGGRQLSA